MGPIATREAALSDQLFSVVARSRPCDLVSPGFEAVVLDRASLDRSTLDRPADGLELGPVAPVAPWVAVELEVESVSGTLVAGLAGPTGLAGGEAHVLGTYDPRTGRVGIEVRADGRTTVVRTTRVRPRLPSRPRSPSRPRPSSWRFAVAVCENQVTVLTHTGRAWRPLLTERRAVARLLDLRRPGTLAGLRHAWGARGGPAEVVSVRAGVFGLVGVRDLHVVQDADGTPLVEDGKVWLYATCGGLGFFPQAHGGVFTLDLDDPTRLEQVAHLFTTRDGLVLGDHAGQLVRDGDRWLVATSSWGDFARAGVHVRHTATRVDVLRGVHVLATEPTLLPTTLSSWDPGTTRIDGRWWVAYVASPSQHPFDFHPALAAGPVGGAPWEGLEPVGDARDLHRCEGPVLTELDEGWRVLASDGAGRRYPAYDLRMRRVGHLDAPYPSNIPHPQLVPLPDGSRLLVTFDGTPFGGRAGRRVLGYGGHGDLVVMRSRPHPGTSRG